jgi:hypothetical protein
MSKHKQLSSFLFLLYSVIINTSSITLNTFFSVIQAKEEQEKRFLNKMIKKLSKIKADPNRITAAGSTSGSAGSAGRGLATTTESNFIFSKCTSTTNYTINTADRTITRKGNNGYTGEYYVVLNNVLNLNPSLPGAVQSVVYNVTVTNLGDGLIFFGGCRAPSLTNDLVNSGFCKAENGIKFSGLGIIYFGEQCYHLDAFSDDNYVLSVRTCLSEYTVKNINYMVNITYIPYNPANSQQCLSVEVSFDGITWFTTKDYVLNSSANTDKNSLEIRGKMLPCIWMFVDNTAVKITNFTPTPTPP